MTHGTAVAEICFDESGHDGENLMGGTTPVFAHGSIHMDLEEATDLVTYIRTATRAQSPELKAQISCGPRIPSRKNSLARR